MDAYLGMENMLNVSASDACATLLRNNLNLFIPAHWSVYIYLRLRREFGVRNDMETDVIVLCLCAIAKTIGW